MLCNRSPISSFFASVALSVGLVGVSLPAQGHGTEALAVPPDLALAPASGFVAAGTGMFAQPSSVTVDVPAGASVVQVLAYWQGFNTSVIGDNTLVLNGTEVFGEIVGGPTWFFNFNGSRFYGHAYRADVTSLGLVGGSGPSTVVLDGLTFVDNMGAGLIVFYDDGTEATIELREGQDLAFANFAAPLDATVGQEFTFPAAEVDRGADLLLFAGSVGEDRPNRIEIAIDGGAPLVIDNALGSSDGPEWDTWTAELTIPAGATSVRVQLFSIDDGSGQLPASLAWVNATLGVHAPEQVVCIEHLTANWWKDNQDLWGPTGLAPDDLLVDVFELCGVTLPRWVLSRIGAETTLLDALCFEGGCGWTAVARRLLKHATAGVLNASHPDVCYRPSPNGVVRATLRALHSCNWWWIRCTTRHLICKNWNAKLCPAGSCGGSGGR